jgi:hypothetical protein
MISASTVTGSCQQPAFAPRDRLKQAIGERVDEVALLTAKPSGWRRSHTPTFKTGQPVPVAGRSTDARLQRPACGTSFGRFGRKTLQRQRVRAVLVKELDDPLVVGFDSTNSRSVESSYPRRSRRQGAAITLPRISQAFAIMNARDMAEKLWWELEADRVVNMCE